MVLEADVATEITIELTMVFLNETAGLLGLSEPLGDTLLLDNRTVKSLLKN